MVETLDVLALGQLEARELAGRGWTVDGDHFRFADYDADAPGHPPWKTGTEGIAFPLLGPDGVPRAYVKFPDEQRVTAKRVGRAKWLIEQRLHSWAAELSCAPGGWLDTRAVGRPNGIEFDFQCSWASAAPGRTWQEVKCDIVDGIVRLDEPVRRRCVANLLRGLALLERGRIVHGDLSPNNVTVELQSSGGGAVLFLIDFDGFVAPAAGDLSLLAVGEGGTFGTRGYCAPELEQLAGQCDRSVAPVSDRYGRDMLLIELLCFDARCDFEAPPSEWDRQQLRSALARNPLASKLPHLSDPHVFDMSEDQRPVSGELASRLQVPLPPRRKQRPVQSRRGVSFKDAMDRLGASFTLLLWMFCFTSGGFLSARVVRAISFWIEPNPNRFLWRLALGEMFVGYGMFIAMTAIITILAFAQQAPRVLRAGPVSLALPARPRWAGSGRLQTILFMACLTVALLFAYELLATWTPHIDAHR